MFSVSSGGRHKISASDSDDGLTHFATGIADNRAFGDIEAGAQFGKLFRAVQNGVEYQGEDASIRAVDATSILRHKPPFRFIDRVFLLGGDLAMASIPSAPPPTKWALPAPLSVLPAEYVAQMMRALLSGRLGQGGTVGLLAGISHFSYVRGAESPSYAALRYKGNRGAFHDFEADFLSANAQLCAKATGTTHISSQETATAQVQVDASEDAPIYDIIEIKDDGNLRQAQLSMRPDCPVYAGHFPGAPITPGVLIAEMMLAVAAHDCPDMCLHSITDLVFNVPLFPGDSVNVNIKETSPNHYSATLMRDGKRLSRAKLHLEREADAAASSHKQL